MKYFSISFLFFILLCKSCKKDSRGIKSQTQKTLGEGNTIDSIYGIYKKASFDNDSIAFKKALKTLQFHWDSIPELQKAHVVKRQGFYHYNNNRIDSAYYYYRKAKNRYNSLGDSMRVARTLMNMAIMRKEIGDYIEAETASFEALRIFDKLEEAEWSSNLYNTLGNIYVKIEDYNSAEKYLKKAIEKREYLQDDTLKLHSVNNLGYFYQKIKKYPEAISQYNMILEKSELFQNDPTFIAMVKDNLTYAKFKAQRYVEEQDFLQPLKIRKEENDVSGQILNYKHLSEYYANQNLEIKATKALNNALRLAEEFNYIEEKIDLLRLFMDVQGPKEAIKTARTRSKILDSITKEKYKQREKFARIAYETDKTVAENKTLKIEKEKETKQKWLFGVGLLLALISLGLITLLYRKNKRQKENIETLQKELHHRVKNNLSIIDTFIEVTKEKFDDKTTEVKLTELQNRIESINEIHQQLYNSKDITNINLSRYLNTLTKNIQTTFSNPNVTLSNTIPADLTVPTNQSFPIGLIVNEFVTNSYKYAFGDGKGIISINIEDQKNKLTLTLFDNGTGFSNEMNSPQTEGFGLRIIKLLAQQLNGTFELSSKNGVHLNVVFPKV